MPGTRNRRSSSSILPLLTKHFLSMIHRDSCHRHSTPQHATARHSESTPHSSAISHSHSHQPPATRLPTVFAYSLRRRETATSNCREARPPPIDASQTARLPCCLPWRLRIVKWVLPRPSRPSQTSPTFSNPHSSAEIPRRSIAMHSLSRSCCAPRRTAPADRLWPPWPSTCCSPPPSTPSKSTAPATPARLFSTPSFSPSSTTLAMSAPLWATSSKRSRRP